MARREIHTADIKIEQKAPIVDHTTYDGDVVIADDDITNKEWIDELAFNEEPVTIRIEPSAEKHAANAYPVWVNGKGAEVFQRGKWMEIGYLPVGRTLIVKRKYIAVLAAAKFDRIATEVEEVLNDNPINKVNRFTSASVAFSVLEDANPKGRAWLTELIRRNM